MNGSVFSFTGIYNEEDFWRELPGSRLSFYDLSQLPGTNGYLSDDAASEIRRTLDRADFDRTGLRGIHFIDSGNTHYMTKLFVERVREPFALVLFDHHPDMLPPAFGGLLSCGSWLRAAMEENPYLRQAVLIGPDPGLFREALAGDLSDGALSDDRSDGVPTRRFAGKPLTLLPEGPLPFLLTAVSDILTGEEPLWISVDKDVLSAEEVQTNWDQGGMATGTLYGLLRSLKDHARILGVDICGECALSDTSRDSSHAVRQNDTINANLLDIFQNAL